MDDPLVFTEFTVGSGLRVLHQYRDLPWFGSMLVVWAGHRHTPRGKEELAHLTEHLVGCGTKGYAYENDEDLETALAIKGWRFDMGVSELEHTYYTLFADVADIDESLEFLDAYVRRPKLRRGIRQELRIIARERIDRYDEESRSGAEHLYMALYRDGHFARIPGWSDRADLDALTMKDVREFHRTWYDCPNMTLIVVGGVEEGRVQETVERRFPTRDPRYTVTDSEERVRIMRPVRRLHDMRPSRGAKHATTLNVHWLLPPGMGDGLGLALHILGAELTKELRTVRAQTYNVDVSQEFYRDHRTVAVNLTTIPEALHQARRTLNAILRDEERILRGFHYYKRTFIDSMRYDDTTVAETMVEALRSIVACGTVRSYAMRRKAAETLMPQDVLGWFREWLTPERAFTELSGH